MPAFVKSFFLPVCRIFYGRVPLSTFARKYGMTDVQSALDFMMTVKYETGCTRLAVNKEALTEDFFILSTGVAGKVLQKFGREVCHIR